jgi:HEAT repeat protein
MNLILTALLFCQGFQDGETGELRFHRVHLKNGNFIDGDLVKDAPNEVILRLKVGEMKIRRDQIDKVEFVRMKSSNSPAIYRPDPKKGEAGKNDPGKTDAPPPSKVPDSTPESIKKKVDMILFKFKNSPGGDDKQIPYEEIGALGEEAAIYLALRAAAFDMKTQDAIGAALVSLKPTAKVVAVLENHLASESPVLRAFAMNVLCISGGDGAKSRYLRPMLKDPDARVRTMALSMLGSSTDRDWIEPMLDLSTDKDRDVRSRALRIAQNLSEKHGAVDKLTAVMVANLSNSDNAVRIDALQVLGLLGQKDTWIHLARALNDTDAPIRAAAAQALASVAAPESADDVLSAVGREQDRATKLQLAVVVQKLRLVKAVETLIKWLGESDVELSKTAQITLQVLTGETFGPDTEKWTAWWEKYKTK